VDEKKQGRVRYGAEADLRGVLGAIAPSPTRKVGEILNGSGDQDEILVVNGVIGNHASQLLCSQ